MNTLEIPEHSISALLAGDGIRELYDEIDQSKDEALAILSQGGSIHKMYDKGNENSSRPGSTEGTLRAAELYVEHLNLAATGDSDDVEPHPYFGQNLRDLRRAFGLLFGKK